MYEAIAIHEEQHSAVPLASARDAALTAEVLELRLQCAQLRRALDSRAAIDQARGMVMALAPCSCGKAWDVLVDVSQHSNVKLRDVATALVATSEGEPLPTALRRALRLALRRCRPAERA
ncbi:ANTAR domain-containing protein [Streptomyces sp. WM6378]|uniref:ANTAR domain-containing protein n=1 Tax=Streptomyces sp. WM6378 TaxID=1415557 RepID=UPI0006B03171|nr:ANTAR domain-containing protein [Streptomyces sp. WM6378]